ncbi:MULTISPECIES: hypothetical protein [unclassified Moorena]|uniref:hypothetical protein n=1 Tax=unclassified Moorena TaxID=2683338 RepID=UPI0013BE725A|nr:MULTISPECIES: hypothetical protein [unclassified Moorena]NEQ06022.1 hypothetical protein [Moorena sp. SIO4E2]NES40783.1 hypothetical protein [Moorena sp. SIO2C4]
MNRNYKKLYLSRKHSAISYQLSAISYQLSAISEQRLALRARYLRCQRPVAKVLFAQGARSAIAAFEYSVFHNYKVNRIFPHFQLPSSVFSVACSCDPLFPKTHESVPNSMENRYKIS